MRKYSHIGGSEIEEARDWFLADGIDAKLIHREYRDAKKRYREALKAADDGYVRAGVGGLTKKVADARKEMHESRRALSAVQPRSAADAVALLAYTFVDMELHESVEKWEISILENAIRFLNRNTAATQIAGEDAASSDSEENVTIQNIAL